MGFHAVIGDTDKHKMAPRVKATARVTGADQQRKFHQLAGPVTVTKVNVTMPDATVAEKRDGALRQGTTTAGTRNGQTGWVKVAHTKNNYMITVRKPGARHDAVITVQPQVVKGQTVWVARMRVGQGEVKPIGFLTKDKAFEPHRISEEIRAAALMQVKRHGWEAI
jgi:hypothetical protein